MSSISKALIEMVERARADYIMHYRRLRNVIDDRDIADELIHRSEEVGIDDALTRMRENSYALGLARNSPLLSLQTLKTSTTGRSSASSGMPTELASTKRLSESPRSVSVLVARGWIDGTTRRSSIA